MEGAIASDAFKRPVIENSDSRLYTWGLGEYKETKPKDQSYVFWSFGKDKKKGKNGPNYGAVVAYAGSDDVISWQTV